MLRVRFNDKWMSVFDGDPKISCPSLSIRSGHDTLHTVHAGVNIDNGELAFNVCDERGTCSESIKIDLKEVHEAIKSVRYTPNAHSLFDFTIDGILYSVILKDNFIHIISDGKISDSVTDDFMMFLDDWIGQLYERSSESKAIKVRIEYIEIHGGGNATLHKSTFELNTEAYYKYAGITQDFISYYRDRNTKGGSQIIQWLADKHSTDIEKIRIDGLFFVDTLP